MLKTLLTGASIVVATLSVTANHVLAQAGNVAAPANADPGDKTTVRDLPHCDKPLGTISVVEPDEPWWRPLNLESPDTVLRAYVQASGCFTLVDRGRGLASWSVERELSGSDNRQAGSNLGRRQVKAADYLLTPNIERDAPNPSSGSLGGLLGSKMGGLLGGISSKKREANVTLSVVNTRTTEVVATTEGYARKPDVSFGGGGTIKGVSGGYQNTDVGRTLARAYLEAYIKLVEQARATADTGAPFASGTSDAPFLPWPPPSPSGISDVTRFFRPSARLGDLDDQIRVRLATKGYEKLRHFSIPGGFGVTTDVERINSDGSPAAQRWQVGKLPVSGGLLRYVTALFAGEEGRFRLFTFLVTNQEPVPADYKASQMDIDRWKTSGRLFLSRQMSAAKVRPGTKVWLLVYEFEQSRSKGGKLVAPEQDGLPFSKHVAILGIQ